MGQKNSKLRLKKWQLFHVLAPAEEVKTIGEKEVKLLPKFTLNVAKTGNLYLDLTPMDYATNV